MEILKNITETANERLKSPFIASFIFAWLALNWDAIALILAGNGGMEYRINLIKNDYLNWWHFIFALGLALFYTLVFPWLTTLFEFLTNKPRKLVDKIKDSRRIQTLELNRDAAVLEYEYSQAKSGSKTIQDHENLVANLQSENNNLQEIINGNTNALEEASERLIGMTERKDKLSKLLIHEQRLVKLWFELDNKSTYIEVFFEKAKSNHFLNVIDEIQHKNIDYDLPVPINLSVELAKNLHHYGLTIADRDEWKWTIRSEIYLSIYSQYIVNREDGKLV